MRPLRRGRPTLLVALVVAVSMAAAACGGGSEGSVATTTTEAPTTTSTVPPTTSTTITATPARKVLLLGDSTMVDAAPAMMAMFEATGAEVVSKAAPGYGLTQIGVSGKTSPFRDDYARFVAEEQPDLVVVLLGAWDLSYIQDNGVAAYSRVVDEAMTLLTAQGAKVLWLAFPPGGSRPGRIQDGAFKMAELDHPGQVFYVDYEAALRGPDGEYPSSYVAADGSTVHLRKADDFHFCPDGAGRLAAEVNRLGVAVGVTVPAPPGWEDGLWQTSPLYRDAACTA